MTPMMISVVAFVAVTALVGLMALMLRDSGAKTSQRLDSLVIDCLFVHACLVIVTDFLVDGIALRIVGGSLLKNPSCDEAITLGKLAEAAPAPLIRRNWGVLDPGATGILIEVVAGIGCTVHRREVEAVNLGYLFGALRV